MRFHHLPFLMCLLAITSALKAQDLIIYSLNSYQISSGKYIGLLSFADRYPLGKFDSIAIPALDLSDSLTGIETDKGRYIKLEGKYRENLLKRTNISENDKAFMYDYRKNVLTSVSIKKLRATACINIYEQGQGPFSASQYMMGFEIDTKYLKDFDPYFSTVLVYVGKENPFEQGKVRPMVWKAANPDEYPMALSVAEDTLQSTLRRDSTGDTYKYEDGEFKYFARDFLVKNYIVARHLSVTDTKTGEIVYDEMYYETESASPAPLNNMEITGSIQQYAGELFKNKPSVMLGFNDVSFGCPAIVVLDKPIKFVWINCSNFH